LRSWTVGCDFYFAEVGTLRDAKVSVPHRVELEAFHSRKIVLERRKGGARLVSDINLVPRKGGRRLLGRFLRQRKATKKAA
jgi:putative ATP-binding cassette transporter